MSDERRIRVWVQAFPDRPHLVLQWHDPTTGKRKSKSAGTADEKIAENKRADLEADLNAGRHQESSSISWARFRELFEAEYLTNLRSATQTLHRYVLDLFEELARPARLAGIDHRVLSRFVAEMRKKPTHGRIGLNPSTIKRNAVFIRIALRWAVKQKLLPVCPELPAIKVSRKTPQPIPAESFERLLEKAPDQQTRAFLLVGWLSGLRLSEAHALRWKESKDYPYLDLDRNRIILPAEFVKGDRDQWVPLDPLLRETLLALPRSGPRVFRFVAADGHEVSVSAVSGRIVDLAHKAGVKLSMHALRKGFGCRYAGKVPAQVLQKLMRHANIQTTVTYYTNVDDAVEAAVLGEQGPRRNAGRNKPESDRPILDQANDATIYPDNSTDC
jgi:integrase